MRLEYGIVDSTMKLAEYLSNWINELSGYCFVKVHSVTGNHSEIRPLKAKAREFEDENLERIIMWYLKERLRFNPNVEVEDDCKKLQAVDVCGYNFVLLHGDGERNIEQIARDAGKSETCRRVHFYVCGHRHSEAEIPTGDMNSGSYILRVPSVCGTDSYAASKGYDSRPGATVIVMERGYGRRCVYPIKMK